ncbi:SDR family NAD(P)-dependent oxidoreductase [Methylovirgula sp. 4M-Z18]|uniref:SDR family NAD(P)-dependent oxidoreductase n=1 Tax=Methylovirgula sp. 4M-Z18 TaxID=2293567 RepID=UPI000E2F56C1|nr:SDR family NAD(P)-dependent oxidoreductase [Methylovirgula sp. 4M-Z18]RFB80048.1 SDR family NAD(P)-dependent oxidoreductase [Methylovirgula sp. 4M-Z18]
MRVANIPAIVTGGASGLGEATARALRAAGAQVAILDFNLAAAKTIAAEIGALALQCDVASAASAEAAVAAATAAQGSARILVNCAGIAPGARVVGRNGPMPLDDFRKGIEVNLIGTFNLIRLVAAGASTLEPLEGGERGVLISTASIAAFDGQIGQASYAASKAGVAGMTLPIARELARFGIRAVTIAPGIFETAMLRGLPENVQQSLGAGVPFPSRLGQPDEYARLVMAIIDNPMLNGEVIRLDGALRMPPQ